MIELTEHHIRLPALPRSADGMRVAHLTDFHRSKMTQDHLLRHAVAVTMGLSPDLIVLTGDFVTDRASDIEPCGHILAPLSAPLGVIAILGNHDYTTDAPAVERELTRRAITVLKRSPISLANGLRVVGIDDHHATRSNISQAFESMTPEEPSLTLIHNPASVELLGDRNCLALAGHTHGGQLRIPFLTTWAVRQIGAKHYHSGWYNVGRIQMYVNRGLGRVGVPIRYRSRPEIAILTLSSG